MFLERQREEQCSLALEFMDRNQQRLGIFPLIRYTQQPRQQQVLHPSIPSFLLRTCAGRKFKRAVGGSERKQQNHPGKAQEPLQNWYLAELT